MDDPTLQYTAAHLRQEARQWRVLRPILPILYALFLLLPPTIFFRVRGGLAALPTTSLEDFSYAIFPLFGLIAFTLLWLQFLIGATMAPLRFIYPRIFLFHRAQGVFTLVFSLMHPTLLSLGLGLTEYLKYDFVPPELFKFVLLGYFQLALMITTVSSALLIRTRLFSRRWRYLHLLNYVLFVSVWIHSWFLGTDVQATPLKYFWLFAGATAIAATAWRLVRSRSPVHT